MNPPNAQGQTGPAAPPSSPFEITRRDPAGNASALLPSPAVLAGLTSSQGTTRYARGLAVGADPLDANSFVPAGLTNFIGHLTRDVVDGGLQLADRIFGRSTPTPTGTAGPFATGDQVTCEKAMEIEVEGALILQSGTRSITAATPVGSTTTFESGQVCLANQSGDYGFYTITANSLTPSVAGALRIRLERI